MKKTSLFIIIISYLMMGHFSIAQQIQSHHPQSPPLNSGSQIIRGMYVDCADEVITDISNGNVLGEQQMLFDYIRNDYIRYIVLCGLENANVFGDPVKEGALHTLIISARDSFPGIKIGISGSDAGSFVNSGYVTLSPSFRKDCFNPTGIVKNKIDLLSFMNDQGLNGINQKRSELCKFFYRAASFGQQNQQVRDSTHCKGAFDDLYLQYRYWEQTSSLSVMQNAFTDFKTILSVMDVLKCNYSCLRNVDAEFLPTDLFKLQAWTANDQITEAEPLVDRLMIPDMTSSANNVFDQVCKTFHFMSDPYSKPHSVLFFELSAEGSAFNYCNSTQTPPDYLGNYLNGQTSPSGNMYSVEKKFVDKFNDAAYFCPACHCQTYLDNHYSSSNSRGNVLAGVMWYTYSMLKDHNLSRSSIDSNKNETDDDIVSIQLIDMNGRVISEYKNIKEIRLVELSNMFISGIYFERMIYSDGNIKVKKHFIN